MTVISTKRMDMVEAEEGDIPAIIAMELHPENRPYIWLGTEEEHRSEIADPAHMLLLFRDRDLHETVGYALIHLGDKSHVFELRRIAITQKHRGYGREAMVALIHYAFSVWGANRVWLDVYPDNEVGIHLYESLGMHRDGVLRQNYLSERGYLDQIIYSLLRQEYDQWASRFPARSPEE